MSSQFNIREISRLIQQLTNYGSYVAGAGAVDIEKYNDFYKTLNIQISESKYALIGMFDQWVKLSGIVSDKMRKYYVNKFAIKLLSSITSDQIHIDDFDKNLFEFDKENKLVIINNESIKLDDIKHKYVKLYCEAKINTTDQYIYKYILETITCKTDYIWLDIKMYNSLESPEYKFNVLKYMFSKFELNHGKILYNVDEIFKLFLDHHKYLVKILYQLIMTNNIYALEYVLKNKPEKIKQNIYDELQEYSTTLRLFGITNVLIKYDSIDFELNTQNANDVDD